MTSLVIMVDIVVVIIFVDVVVVMKDGVRLGIQQMHDIFNGICLQSFLLVISTRTRTNTGTTST
jgi:exosome complex RNA-binding protein Rrp42 (RNase PH superfamily)